MASRKVLPIDGAVTFVVVVVFLVPSVLLLPPTFKNIFIKKCLEFKAPEAIIQKAWTNFELGHVGKDPSQVTAKDYEKLFTEVPFKHPCDKTLLYSKTKFVVHKFTDKGQCFVPIEKTFLGYVLNDLNWCGQKNSLETYIADCQSSKINPVSSFWETASIRFAQHASDKVTVMLNGEVPDPYDSESFFARFEVPNLQPSEVKEVFVILSVDVMAKQCNNESLKKLENVLREKGIKYVCKEVLRSDLLSCEHEQSADGICPCQDLFKV